jgi:hypothetical protein
MQKNSLQAGQRLQGGTLESHLRTFVTSLLKTAMQMLPTRSRIARETLSEGVHAQ